MSHTVCEDKRRLLSQLLISIVMRCISLQVSFLSGALVIKFQPVIMRFQANFAL